MCFDALIEDGHEDKSVTQLLREELPSATQDGGVAALVVLFMLVAFGSTPLLVAGATVAAFALAVVVHQAVLLAGLAVRRAWTARQTVPPTADPE